jgi:cytochrome d ubiquinol oxidase subunit II
MIFDYMTLKIIWWGLVGVLIIGFALLDGFDMGIGILLPFVAKTDEQRRVLLNSIGTTWEGNQTWFITAGGTTFAAWPLVYSAAFSGFYVALMLLLFALFFRPVGFDYRSKLADPRWRNAWDWALFAGGAVPALIFGVAFGNLLLGTPFRFDDSMRLAYEGNFFSLLTPFALLSGLISVAMLCMHGASYLQIKTEGAIAQRARRAAQLAAVVTLVGLLAAGYWVASVLPGYHITQMPDANSAFMPLAKTVSLSTGGWLDNYHQHPVLWLIPALSIAGALLCIAASARQWSGLAFVASGITVATTILTAASALFPFIMPSALDPASSLTIWDAVSSHKTLNIMFWIVVTMMPVVMLYTSWVYSIMRGKVTEQQIRDNTHTAY